MINQDSLAVCGRAAEIDHLNAAAATATADCDRRRGWHRQVTTRATFTEQLNRRTWAVRRARAASSRKNPDPILDVLAPIRRTAPAISRFVQERALMSPVWCAAEPPVAVIED